MRNTFALGIAIMASKALAEDLMANLDNNPDDDTNYNLEEVLEDNELAHHSMLQRRSRRQNNMDNRYCFQRSTDINDRCYFKSTHYLGKDKETKMSELWSKIRPDE